MAVMGGRKAAIERSVRTATVGLALVCGGCTDQHPDGLYQTDRVDRGDIRVSVVATGSVRPVGEVRVGSQVSGQIAELLAGFNDTVKRGQVLARLETSTFSARVREAQSAVELAEAQVRLLTQGWFAKKWTSMFWKPPKSGARELGYGHVWTPTV